MKSLPILTVVLTAAIAGVLALNPGTADDQKRGASNSLSRQNVSASTDSSILLVQNEASPEAARDDQPSKKQEGDNVSAEKDETPAESTPLVKASPEAEATLKQARERLKGYRSVQANIIEKVIIGSRRFKATGRYLQGTDLKLRLEFEIQLGTSRGSLLQVCDGEMLWTRQMVALKPIRIVRDDESPQTESTDPGDNGETSLDQKQVDKSEDKSPYDENVKITRRNVREILDAALDADVLPENLLVAELGLGGMPGLLASLQRTMVFDHQKEEVVDKKKFTVIEGTWNEKFRTRWQATTNSESGDLPEYIPDRVRVYFSQENLFPLRILYLKRVVGRKIFRPMVTVDLKDVVVNAAIDESEFNYEPPDGEYPADVTKQYIQQLILTRPKTIQNHENKTNVEETGEPSSKASNSK